jgi:uncharacterized membrane protein
MARQFGSATRAIPWRTIGWGMAALLLLLPLAAMRFTDEVDWSGGDFLFAAVLLGSVGSAFELATRMSRDKAYRAAAAAALAAPFAILWTRGAVGMIGDESNPHNLLFLGVIGFALSGAIAVRFRAKGMALLMAAAAVAHLIAALAGLPVDPQGATLSVLLAAPWLLSAALFRKAGRAADLTRRRGGRGKD